ncbi:glycoside hydrolase family 32 protein [Porcincola intestinalis]|uniref:glycoside hydrolase family 32 protein n=1 Tax=Porcincola intestinalis TaxID=2606632 RepID=UPI002A80823F|nr:glycoside hydrolase family 32 protein [Porcincola intestinalis]MDY4203958.1 glycoside hydrolase family 32 protein [Porcincola intestinalis]
MSKILEDARKYEEEMGSRIPADARPHFHLSSRVGWMNDPNGFSWYKGQYHLFYQYNPYDTVWGPMHWGHAVSDDLLHWQYLPAALAPDEEYDKDGCFSGSAMTMPDGRQMLIYTGVVRELDEQGVRRGLQRQCVAVGDGLNYEKIDANPILTVENLPEGANKYEFRDPKIWQETDGTYRMVTCCANHERDARIVMFSSLDGQKWSRGKVLIRNNGRFGSVWECPEFFRLDGKWVLLTSPMDMLPEGFEYHNGNGTLCLIGDYDSQTGTFTPQKNQTIDYGIDFYATQTILTPDGRRIMIAWMQNWDTTPGYRLEPTTWFGQMTLPRELSIRDGHLYENPVREIETLRTGEVSYEHVYVDGDTELEGISGRRTELIMDIAPADEASGFRKFQIRFASKGRYYTTLSFHPEEGIVKIDRKFSGSRRAIIHQRRMQLRRKGNHLKIRLILDRFSAEAFFNDGEQVMTVNLYTEQDADGISFSSEGAVSMNITKYDLTL